MTLRIWHQYSCNNSSSYRLVARFHDAASAAQAGAELTAVLAHHGATDRDRHAGFEGLARQYGFDWEDDGWGGSRDGPHVIVDDATLILFHAYCTGLGPGVPAFLTERGAEVSAETWDAVHVSVLFRVPPDPRLDDELAAIAAQPARDGVIERFQAPWVETPARGKLAVFRDAGTVGLFFPIDPRDFARLREWLAERGIDQPIVSIEAHPDHDLFLALAGARCTACNAGLEYLDPRLHDIETPQLVCRPCGGLYDLAAFQRPQ